MPRVPRRTPLATSIVSRNQALTFVFSEQMRRGGLVLMRDSDYPGSDVKAHLFIQASNVTLKNHSRTIRLGPFILLDQSNSGPSQILVQIVYMLHSDTQPHQPLVDLVVAHGAPLYQALHAA